MGDELVLGGGIQLNGFGELDSGSFMIVKKMVGTFVKKVESLNKLSLRLKPVHNRKYEIKGMLDLNGQIKQAEIVDYNLFFALNGVLEKLK
jgi:hypothetical protein